MHTLILRLLKAKDRKEIRKNKHQQKICPSRKKNIKKEIKAMKRKTRQKAQAHGFNIESEMAVNMKQNICEQNMKLS